MSSSSIYRERKKEEKELLRERKTETQETKKSHKVGNMVFVRITVIVVLIMPLTFLWGDVETVTRAPGFEKCINVVTLCLTVAQEGLSEYA